MPRRRPEDSPFILDDAIRDATSYVDYESDMCLDCGTPICQRLVDVQGSGGNWNSLVVPVCIKCSEHACMVQGCEGRATVPIRHEFRVGSGASGNMRNDHFACDVHAQRGRVVSRLNTLVIMGVIVAATTCGLLWRMMSLELSTGVLLITSCALVAILFALPINMFARQKLRIKSMYVIQVQGTLGSVWRDDAPLGSSPLIQLPEPDNAHLLLQYPAYHLLLLLGVVATVGELSALLLLRR